VIGVVSCKLVAIGPVGSLLILVPSSEFSALGVCQPPWELHNYVSDLGTDPQDTRAWITSGGTSNK